MKKLRIIIITFILLTVICAGLLYWGYSNTTFILVYHKIEDYKSGLKSLYVSPAVFNSQMNYLHSRGYRTIQLSELVGLIKSRKPIPKKRFALTFDDGYENNYTNAYPVLKKYDFTGIIFLNAGYIGKLFQYPLQTKEKHLSVQQILEMRNTFEYGAHTMTHPRLIKISTAAANMEIRNSKKVIEKILDKPVTQFCYPFGEYNESIVQLVKKNKYAGACTLEKKLINNSANVYELTRFEFKQTGYMSVKDFIKNLDFYIKTFFML